MKKSPLPKRTTPLPRGPAPTRKTRIASSRKPIKARKADPAKRRWAKHRDHAFLEWIREQPCCVSGRGNPNWADWRDIVAAHVIPRSLGSDDLYNVVPLHWRLHAEQEGRTARFEKKYDVDLTAIAKAHTERFLAEHPEETR